MSVFAKATASRSARAAWTGIAIAGVSALLLTACSTGGNAPAESEEPADTGDAQPIEAGERDLTLKVGTILPQSGTLAFLGPPEEAGVALAAQEINEADAGIQVEVVYRDSGDTTTDIATVSVTDLLSQDVSAIIGAASSGVSFTVIDQITAAGVVQFSPANTSPDFTDYDDNGLYFRTAPSDKLQGEVLGNLIAEDGASTLGLLVLNDPYGTGLAEFTTKAFEEAGGEVVAQELFNTGDSNFDSQLAAINAANPDAVAVITFDEAKVVVPALVGSGYPGDQLYFVDGNLADYSADFAPGLIAGAKGTLPGPKLADDFRERLLGVDDTLADFSYGPESYDALMLIAMAAYAANSTEGTDIGAYLQQVSGGSGDGEKVTTFADAAALLAEGKQVDYDGASGPITLDENGDPTEATIGIYEYGDDNTYERIN
ncbi:ABC transporter substrate-binding protein [Agromyces aurantiacus]|uniref:ABC transporter substrate-binding protein n=1 Tax=Agromyces aurantiacus TaxID=165814 RepID=A0ABV9R0A2_9MICO|nr:ABC transporter substrate-binding protein [Agromyces aurantiacus]MBM7505657.1 branched-chain amino acid transport system substrate-binding protein [Agromyces aurantiacus]